MQTMLELEIVMRFSEVADLGIALYPLMAAGAGVQPRSRWLGMTSKGAASLSLKTARGLARRCGIVRQGIFVSAGGAPRPALAAAGRAGYDGCIVRLRPRPHSSPSRARIHLGGRRGCGGQPAPGRRRRTAQPKNLHCRLPTPSAPCYAWVGQYSLISADAASLGCINSSGSLPFILALIGGNSRS